MKQKILQQVIGKLAKGVKLVKYETQDFGIWGSWEELLIPSFSIYK